ncbi:MAG TPA: hypothetical protein VGG18_05695 [Granulicella sp.]
MTSDKLPPHASTRYHREMEQSLNFAARRTEDIALDLLKFVAGHANLGRTAASSTPGFGLPSSAKPEDQVSALLELYSRCREAVETPTAAPAKK